MNKNDTFDTIVKKIKSLEIQGARNIAHQGLYALMLKTKEFLNTKKTKEDLLPFIDILKNARATEPALRNILDKYIIQLDENFQNYENIYEIIDKKMDDAFEKSIDYASNTIENGMSIFIHCNSSSVVQALIKAKKKGKKFEVYNTEARPKFQGRIAVNTLIKAGINITHMVDNAMHYYMKKADLFMFGADSITSSANVINKVGTKIYAEYGKKYDTKNICVTFSYKYNKETVFGFNESLEKRKSKEIWDITHKNLKIFNPAFDEVEKEYIDLIISEYGALTPEIFIERFFDAQGKDYLKA